MLSPAPGALSGDLQVRVGTLNPAKLRALERALARLGGRPEISGVDVESGVSEQPVGFAEIVGGARNRAHAAFVSSQALAAGGAARFGVGIEDGLVVLDTLGPGEILNIGCAFVVGEVEGRLHEGYGLSSGFAYPAECSRSAVEARAPIGDLFDAWWGKGAVDGPSGRTTGNIGRLSLGALCRDEYAEHAVLCAWLRFLHPDAYVDPDFADSVANPVRQDGPSASSAAVRSDRR